MSIQCLSRTCHTALIKCGWNRKIDNTLRGKKNRSKKSSFFVFPFSYPNEKCMQRKRTIMADPCSQTRKQISLSSLTFWCYCWTVILCRCSRHADIPLCFYIPRSLWQYQLTSIFHADRAWQAQAGLLKINWKAGTFINLIRFGSWNTLPLIQWGGEMWLAEKSLAVGRAILRERH